MKPPDDNSDFSWLVYCDYLQDHGVNTDELREETLTHKHADDQTWLQPEARRGVGSVDYTPDAVYCVDFRINVGAGSPEVGTYSNYEVGTRPAATNSPGVL